ncbi:hypothetical protein CBL_00219 [Carabus blaptoides fortunei]
MRTGHRAPITPHRTDLAADEFQVSPHSLVHASHLSHTVCGHVTDLGHSTATANTENVDLDENTAKGEEERRGNLRGNCTRQTDSGDCISQPTELATSTPSARHGLAHIVAASVFKRRKLSSLEATKAWFSQQTGSNLNLASHRIVLYAQCHRFRPLSLDSGGGPPESREGGVHQQHRAVCTVLCTNTGQCCFSLGSPREQPRNNEQWLHKSV